MKILSNKQYELFLAQQGRIEQLQKENEQLKEEQFTVKCNHVFDSYKRTCDYKRMCQTLYLKCSNCGEIVNINLTDRLLYDLRNDFLRTIIKADNIDFPNSEERSETKSGQININDIYKL